MQDKLILDSGDARFELGAKTLLLFADETGHEEFADEQYPLFGLGGCVVEVEHYRRLVDTPWRFMKRRYFGGENTALHASELRGATTEQLAALEHFFTKFEFARVAALLSDKTNLARGLTPFQIAAESLKMRLLEVAKWRGPFDRVALLFEASERGNRLAQMHFAGFSRLLVDKTRTVSIDKFFVPKSAASGLEVADFIMHAAGGQVRERRRRGADEAIRLDFKAVFQRVDPRASSFMEVTSTEFG